MFMQKNTYLFTKDAYLFPSIYLGYLRNMSLLLLYSLFFIPHTSFYDRDAIDERYGDGCLALCFE
jgi:hypothetical protein